MTPAEKGRFCGQCQKTVVDFTTMTDDEVLDTLQAATGNTCGRFLVQQLDRPLQPTHLQRSWLRVKWFWAALISGALFANRATAQKATYGDTVVVTAPKSNAEVVTMGKLKMPDTLPVIIQGQVTDESGMPMAGVTVQVTGTSQGTTTNGLGMYELRLKDPGQSVQLQYSFVGYMPMQHQLQLAPLLQATCTVHQGNDGSFWRSGDCTQEEKIKARSINETNSGENHNERIAAGVSQSGKGRPAHFHYTSKSRHLLTSIV